MPSKISYVTFGSSWVYRTVDVLVIAPVVILLAYFYIGDIDSRWSAIGMLCSLTFVTIHQFSGGYNYELSAGLFGSARRLVISWSVSWLVLVAMAYLAKAGDDYSRAVLSIWLVSTPIFLFSYRGLFKTFLSSGSVTLKRRVLIVGAGIVGKQLARKLNQSPWLGMQVVGFVDDNLDIDVGEFQGTELLGQVSKTLEFVQDMDIDQVIVCLPQRAHDLTATLFDELSGHPVVVKYVPDIFSFSLMNAKISDIEGIPVVSVYDTPLTSKSAAFVKRVEDLVLSSIILLLISPLMVFISLGVKLSSPGPVFYRQRRVGLNNRTFEMLKFRSMPVDTEKNGVQWGNAAAKTTNKFGAFIRKTSLDELPQFLNVLKGDMSIVGPRPERDVFVEQFKSEIPRYMQKHMVKAGITGLAQISGLRGDTCLRTRIEYDLRYISEWSLFLDLRIIFLTVFKVFKDASAK